MPMGFFLLVKYVRKPIDYSILDDVGHGVRLAQPQQADEDVLLGIFVRQERLPALVGEVVATDQLHLEPEHVAVDGDCALGRYSQETWKR